MPTSVTAMITTGAIENTVKKASAAENTKALASSQMRTASRMMLKTYNTGCRIFWIMGGKCLNSGSG